MKAALQQLLISAVWQITRLGSIFLTVSLLALQTANAQCTTCTQTRTNNTSPNPQDINSGQTLCITTASTLTYSSNFNLQGGTVCIGPGVTWSGGTVNFNNNITINNYGRITRSIQLVSGQTFNNYGTFTGQLNLNGGTFINHEGATATPSSYTINSGAITNDGSLTFNSGVTIGSNVTLRSNSSTSYLEFSHPGQTLTINSGATVYLGGTVITRNHVNNNGTIYLSGTLNVGGHFNQNATGAVIGDANNSCNFLTASNSISTAGTYNGGTGGLVLGQAVNCANCKVNGATDVVNGAPTAAPTNLQVASTGPTQVQGTFNPSAGGTTGYIVLRRVNAAVTDNPNNFTNYTVGQAVGNSVVAAIINDANTSTFIDNNAPSTCQPVHYKIFATAATSGCRVVRTVTALEGSVINPPRYSWNGGNSGQWTDAARWQPTRSSAQPCDVVEFPSNETVSVTSVATSIIGGLILGDNCNVTLTPSAANQTVTISGNNGTAADLVVGTGANLNITSNNAITLSLPAGNTATINGTITLDNAAHRISPVDQNAITFASGATLIQGASFSGSPFGNAGQTNVANFASGANIHFYGGATPFGLVAPNSKIVLNAGSNYTHFAATEPDLTSRTYGRFFFEPSGTLNISSQSGTVSMASLTQTSGTTNITSNLNINIAGNLAINGGTLNYSPSASGTMAITATSTISGDNGTFTLGTNSTLAVNSGVTATLNRHLTTSGTLDLAGIISIPSAPVTYNTGYQLTINGPLTGTGTFTGSNGVRGANIFFAGSGDATLRMTQTSNATRSLRTLNISRPNAVITLANNLRLQGNRLNLVDGTLEIGNNFIDILNNSSTSINRVNGSIRMNNSTAGGGLRWTVGTATGTYLFPFSNPAGEYIPYTAQITSAAAAGATLTVKTFNTGLDALPLPVGVQNLFGDTPQSQAYRAVKRFWQVDLTNPGTFSANVSFTFADAEKPASPFDDESFFKFRRYNTSTNSWDAPLPNQVVNGNTITVPNVTQFSPWGIESDGGPLSLDITDFKVSTNAGVAQLNWQLIGKPATWERTIIVERKTTWNDYPEEVHFSYIPEFLAQVKSSWIDANLPSNGAYYRIKLVQNGEVSAHTAWVHSAGRKDVVSLQPYPQPANEQLFLSGIPVEGLNEYQIFDLTGKVVIEKQILNEVSGINLGQLGSGSYLLVLHNETLTKPVTVPVLKR